MQALNIEATDDSPKVVLDDDNQVFLIEGESRPQHGFKFYTPIIQWLQDYKKAGSLQKQNIDKNRKMTFQFKLSYFNSTSAKYIGDILTSLDSICQEGHDVRAKWFYQKEDTDMIESAEEYMKLMKKLPIQLELIETADR